MAHIFYKANRGGADWKTQHAPHILHFQNKILFLLVLLIFNFDVSISQSNLSSVFRTNRRFKSPRNTRSNRGTRSNAERSSMPQLVSKIPNILPHERVFPIQIGTKLFKLSGASISSDGQSSVTLPLIICYLLCLPCRRQHNGSWPSNPKAWTEAFDLPFSLTSALS